MRRAAIGVSAHLGWAAVSTIAVGARGVRVLRTDRLEIAKPGDREACEPYHVAGGFHGLARVPRPPQPERRLAKMLDRQRELARRCVEALSEELATSGHRIAFAGLLVGRGRASGSFEQAVGSHTQIHIEEGLAVRASLRGALEALGACVEPLDQKTLGTLAHEALGRTETALRSELRAERPGNDGPWRKEEQSAALAAWIAWQRHARR